MLSVSASPMHRWCSRFTACRRTCTASTTWRRSLVDDGGRQVVAVDLRGRGGSESTAPGSYGLQSHARDMFELATLLGHDRFDWVGWSLGALIGIAAAQMEPGRIRRLGMIDHAGRSDEQRRRGSDRRPRPARSGDANREGLCGPGRGGEPDPSVHRLLARRSTPTSSGGPARRPAWKTVHDVAGRDWRQCVAALDNAGQPGAVPVRPLNGGLVVPDDVVADIASTVPTIAVSECRRRPLHGHDARAADGSAACSSWINLRRCVRHTRRGAPRPGAGRRRVRSAC